MIALAPPPAIVQHVKCQEDQPCWTWSTMGNRKRLVVTVNGGALVVGPCRFRRLAEAGQLLPDPLRGDFTALTKGCAS